MRFPASPYGVTVTEDGRFVYDLALQVRGLKEEAGRVHLAWVTTPDLKERRKLGVLGADGRLSGRVDWNKFLVLVTSERSPEVESWEGPILLTAISPSGRLQTMAGEEIFGNNELPIGTRYCLVNRC